MKFNSNIIGVLGAVREVALRDPAINALIGDRIYPFAAPEHSNPPYIITGIDDIEASKAHNGQQHALKYLIGMDVFALDQTQIAQIADALINGLTNFSGEVNSIPITRLWFESTNTQNPIQEGAGKHDIIFAWSLVFRLSL